MTRLLLFSVFYSVFSLAQSLAPEFKNSYNLAEKNISISEMPNYFIIGEAPKQRSHSNIFKYISVNESLHDPSYIKLSYCETYTSHILPSGTCSDLLNGAFVHINSFNKTVVRFNSYRKKENTTFSWAVALQILPTSVFTLSAKTVMGGIALFFGEAFVEAGVFLSIEDLSFNFFEKINILEFQKKIQGNYLNIDQNENFIWTPQDIETTALNINRMMLRNTHKNIYFKLDFKQNPKIKNHFTLRGSMVRNGDLRSISPRPFEGK